MTARDRLQLLAAAVAVLLSGMTIGATLVAALDAPAPTPFTDGAIDFAADRPVNP